MWGVGVVVVVVGVVGVAAVGVEMRVGACGRGLSQAAWWVGVGVRGGGEGWVGGGGGEGGKRDILATHPP